MEKQDPFFELITDIITSSIQTIYFLSPLAVFLAYFMFKDRVNATTDFFLHWTSISILTVIIGSLLQSISTNYYSTKKTHLGCLRWRHRPKSHHDLPVRNLPTRTQPDVTNLHALVDFLRHHYPHFLGMGLRLQKLTL